MSQVYTILLLILSFYSFTTICTSINDINTPKTYIVRIQNELKPTNILSVTDWYKSILGDIVSSNSPNNPDFIHVYNTVFHGFSIQLTPQQVNYLKTRHEVIGVFEDEIYQLHTTRSPHFLGLDSYRNPTGVIKESDAGSNIVVGVLDTGIWPTSMSFHDEGLGSRPQHFKGECVGGYEFPPSLCNNKIVGSRYFSSGMKAFGLDSNETAYDSAIDKYGHGTHTASTIAGRTLTKNVSFFGYANGQASGVAPKARLAIYKVCWTGGCVTSDVLAGFDKAVEEGVDIVSISLGGSPRRFVSDVVAIAAFAAADKGVFVSASGGNSGPTPGRVSNNAPWYTTVAASTIDRKFTATLKLSNGDSIIGASISTAAPLPPQEMYPIVHFPEPFDAQYCLLNSSFEGKNITGKIVVCLPGFVTEVEKGLNVHNAGGIGVVVTSNVIAKYETLYSRPYTIPGLSIAHDASSKLLELINKTQINGTIIIQGTVIGQNPAPIVGDFSSRGPNSQSVYVLKPDVTAPGVDILAAWPSNISPSRLPEDPRRTDYNILTGTSMSCPHVSGVAALIKGAHPDWTPAMIRSAMMTTAYKGLRSDVIPSPEQPYMKDVTPWDIGAGHVNPEGANEPGLVYDLTTDDYINFLCASNYTTDEVKTITRKQTVSCDKRTSKPWDINYPGIVVTSTSPEMVVTRTLTNVDTSASGYEVKVVQPVDVSVTIEPSTLSFDTKGKKQSYTVKIKSLKASIDGQRVGLLTWTNGKRVVTIPLVVYDQLDVYN